MPKISIFLEKNSPVTHELTGERITIGRGGDNILQIDDPSVSQRHAELSLIGDNYQLKDLGSTNGTRVNGILVRDSLLRVGDGIRFGKVEARYESDATGEAQPLRKEGGESGARLAETSVKPADFANASPFPNRQKEKDTAAIAVLAVAGLAVIAFLVSMFALLKIHIPG
ncbi:MAG TPA: FHA domain-containing protein [Chthoniobacterales bacterium]|nr:FHA domain-containing protein [Chthoniobacterales bacterium]